MDPPQDLGEIGPWVGGGFQSVTPDPQHWPHLELVRTQVLRLRPAPTGRQILGPGPRREDGA